MPIGMVQRQKIGTNGIIAEEGFRCSVMVRKVIARDIFNLQKGFA